MKYPFELERFILAVSILMVVIGLVLLLGGCASLGESRSDGVRAQHEVTVTKKQVVVPATETVAEHVVNTTETVERWLDEKTRTEAHNESHTAPDLPAVEKVVSAGVSLIPSGTGIGDLVKLIAGAGTAYVAMRGTMKAVKDQSEFHKRDAEEGWQKAGENQQRAEQYARQLPPSMSEDRS